MNMQDNSNHHKEHLHFVMLQAHQNREEQARYNEEKRRSWIQFWVPLIISDLISLSALIVAILAYLKQ